MTAKIIYPEILTHLRVLSPREQKSGFGNAVCLSVDICLDAAYVRLKDRTDFIHIRYFRVYPSYVSSRCI
jgi:hypothetical protein